VIVFDSTDRCLQSRSWSHLSDGISFETSSIRQIQPVVNGRHRLFITLDACQMSLWRTQSSDCYIKVWQSDVALRQTASGHYCVDIGTASLHFEWNNADTVRFHLLSAIAPPSIHTDAPPVLLLCTLKSRQGFAPQVYLIAIDIDESGTTCVDVVRQYSVRVYSTAPITRLSAFADERGGFLAATSDDGSVSVQNLMTAY
jgi:hypothetical protein